MTDSNRQETIRKFEEILKQAQKYFLDKNQAIKDPLKKEKQWDLLVGLEEKNPQHFADAFSGKENRLNAAIDEGIEDAERFLKKVSDLAHQSLSHEKLVGRQALRAFQIEDYISLERPSGPVHHQSLHAPPCEEPQFIWQDPEAVESQAALLQLLLSDYQDRITGYIEKSDMRNFTTLINQFGNFHPVFLTFIETALEKEAQATPAPAPTSEGTKGPTL